MFIERLSAMSYCRGTEEQRSFRAGSVAARCSGVRARPQVQLAIGKFVKEPFDEESRRNMFGQRAKEMTGKP